MGKQPSLEYFFTICSLPVPMGLFEPFILELYVEYSTTVL